MATESLKKRNHPPKKSRIELSHEFVELPADALVTSAQLAAFYNFSEAKLERDRWAGSGIPFIKLGRHVRYVKQIALTHVGSMTRISTTQGFVK